MPADSLRQTRLDHYAICIVHEIPHTKKSIVRKFGKPIAVKSGLVPNEYNPQKPDTSFELQYKDFVVLIEKAAINNREFIKGIEMRSHFKAKCNLFIGEKVDKVKAYFGSANVESDSVLKYCTKSLKMTPYFGIELHFEDKKLSALKLEIPNP